MKIQHAVLAAGCLGVLSSCGMPRIDNAPPEIVEDCQRDVAILIEMERPGSEDDAVPEVAPGSAPDTIEDARTARAEASAPALTRWPEDALMYRCLASRGIELTPAQAKELARWERQFDPESNER